MIGNSDKILKNVAANVKFYRLKAGYSQLQLGIKLSKGAEYISQIERGFRTPTLKSLCDIAFALNVEPAELLK